ncbi:PREDICTED: E3 ubiquitin-protein ligase PDZRN3 [Trachymyrmex septentrionalis]|uniref:E3 ubiquitin-protein ligase PDZRN3 n=1 Tax=Trachymyrmex septentrionalis TaxID=34720 RepID=UPI00084F0FB2|nr:PREDICTED: E3 ubiquitin-protein ligase PDZRN3 [Trachymyrmex septentrionalis]
MPRVNGKDVSNSSHEDAIRCFQLAQEPIIVEVLRRQPNKHQQVPHTPSKIHENITCQDKNETTNERGEKICNNDVNKDNTTCNLISTSVQTDWAGLIEVEELFPVPFVVEEQANDSFEDFLTHDIDFEEVTLRKSDSAEKLGLTVCYSSGSGSEDFDTEVYISEIIPESLAARDGRLREGDQILQVNGKDVANKEQTENLFAETKNAVTILVSRCVYQDDEYHDRRIYHQDLPSFSLQNLPYQNSMIEQLIQQQTEERTKNSDVDNCILKAPPPIPSHTQQQQQPPQQQQSSLPQQQQSVNNFSTNLSSTCSSHSSYKSYKSKNATLPEHRTKECNKQWMQKSLKDCLKRLEDISLCDQQSSPLEATPLSVKLIEAYSSHVWSDSEHIYETIPELDSEPIYSSPYEHHQQHWTQQTNYAMTTQHNGTAKTYLTNGQQNQKWHSSLKSNSSGEEKDSSSAYNTGESCHSNPLTLELHEGKRDHYKSTLVLCSPKTLQQQKIDCNCPMLPTATFAVTKQSSKNQNVKKSSSSSHHRDRNKPLLMNFNTMAADTMYTNVANLQQTMMLQQQLFKQALNRKNLMRSKEMFTSGVKKPKSYFQAPNLTQYQFVGSQQVCTSTTWIPTEDKNEVQMEWKVKRRADGTRYIARRPVRNRILRNRAIKITEERAGHTTEDDTMSEMKVGRYWSKEERKRQLERAREHKQRQQELILQQEQQQVQQTNDLLICEHTEDKMSKKPLNIIELSYKKMVRKKTTLDDFTTVQEMLVHGNKVGTDGSGTGGKLMGLLSVTTV